MKIIVSSVDVIGEARKGKIALEPLAPLFVEPLVTQNEVWTDVPASGEAEIDVHESMLGKAVTIRTVRWGLDETVWTVLLPDVTEITLGELLADHQIDPVDVPPVVEVIDLLGQAQAAAAASGDSASDAASTAAAFAADTAVDPTPDKLVRRTDSGQVKAADPVDSDDVVTLGGVKRLAAPAVSAFQRTHDGFSFGLSRLGVTFRVDDYPSMESVYWPGVFDTVGTIIENTAPGRFLYWCSTDHDTGAGGLFVWFTDEIDGEPITAPARVYFDDEGTGFQTETFRLVYWPEQYPETPFFWTYSQSTGLGIGQQQTLRVLSDDPADPDSFTGRLIIGDVATLLGQPGDGHCGYLTPSLLNGYLMGPALRGNTGAGSMQAWYRSTDGTYLRADEQLLDRRVSVRTQMGGMSPTRVGSEIVIWQGRRVCIHGILSAPGVTAKSRVCWSDVSEDGRQLLGLPHVLFEPTEGYELDAYNSFHAAVIEDRLVITVHYDPDKGTGAGAPGTTSGYLATYIMEAS